MKKKFWVYILIITVVVFFLQACNSKQTNNVEVTSTSNELYTCSMHPQILEHHPGDCPICNMKLIKKNAKPVALNNIDHSNNVVGIGHHKVSTCNTKLLFCLTTPL